MSLFTKLGNDIASPVDAAGNLRSVDNADMQRWMTEAERLLAAQSMGAVTFGTLAQANGSLAYDPWTTAWVLDDPVVGNNGWYTKTGASGAGGWVRVGDLPYCYIRATNAGAGSANAIVATTTMPIPVADGGALISLNITSSNTATPVTVSFNGAPPLTIKTNAGNNPVIGGLVAGTVLAGYKAGIEFRLLSDQASAAILSAVEAVELRVQAYAAMLSADKIKFKTVQLLLADELMSYADEPGKIQVGPGDVIEAGGFRYEVAASAATDAHVETAGGVKLYEVGPFTTVDRFKSHVARGATYPVGASVVAGGTTYIFRGFGDDLVGLPGWSSSRVDLPREQIPLVDIAEIIESPKSVNKWNPAISDVSAPSGDAAPAIGTTTANQLHRQRGQTTGLLATSNPATLGTFWASRKTPLLKPSTTYTMSIHGAPGGAYFYTNGFLQFFNADGSLHSYITSGFTVSPAGVPREITFTTPAASVSVAPNMRNASDFSNVSPVTAEHVEIVNAATMLNEGSVALEFSEFSGGSYIPAVGDFDPVSDGQVSVVKQGTEYYVRAAAQASEDKDVVWKVISGRGVDYNGVDNRNGTVNFRGIRFIDKSASLVSTIAAYNLSTDVHSLGFDESCPVRLNSMYLAGSHGVIGRAATMVAHGKANVDVGSIWSDGTSEWVLHYIDSVDVATFVRRYTGASDKWSIATATFGSATLTHVSGATNTANFVVASSVQSQSAPAVKEYLAELRVDDVPVVDDGVYPGQRVVLAETYALMNIAAQQDYLVANVGASSPDYAAAGIQNQVRFAYVFEWNAYGAMSVRAGHGVKDAYRRSVATDYWGGIQLQRLALADDSQPGMHDSVSLYIPGAENIGGSNYQAILDITANTTEVRIPRTSLVDPSDPASHFALIGKSGETFVSGHLYGYSREVGLGVPAVRAAAVNDVMFYSSMEKQYPIAIDQAAGDAAVGDADFVTAFRAPYLPTDAELTVPGLIVDMDGSTYCYIAAHQTLENKSVEIPARLNGRAVTVLSSTGGMNVQSDVVAFGAVVISVENYGDAVLKLV